MVNDAPAQAELDAAEPRDRERIAVKALARLNGPSELHAALLALLLPHDDAKALLAWRAEVGAAPELLVLPDQARSLTGATRLPCFELLLSRMAPQPLAVRNALLESTRRVMRTPGRLRPIDRLHWLAMRLRLGDQAFFGSRTTAADDPSLLPESDVRAISRFTAYLARMVPGGTAGPAWFASVLARWRLQIRPSDARAPDADGLVQAMQELQALAWSHRPVLVRGWVLTAMTHSRHHQLDDTAADALRLASTLLDSPLPPELARHYSPAIPEVRR